jgi:hypothetical protein
MLSHLWCFLWPTWSHVHSESTFCLRSPQWGLRAQNKLVRVEDVVFKKVLCETLKSSSAWHLRWEVFGSWWMVKDNVKHMWKVLIFPRGESRESIRTVDIYRHVPSLDGLPQISGHAQIQVAATRTHIHEDIRANSTFPAWILDGLFVFSIEATNQILVYPGSGGSFFN